jgi:hypothetical protein
MTDKCWSGAARERGLLGCEHWAWGQRHSSRIRKSGLPVAWAAAILCLMLRAAAILICTAAPAFAWEARVSGAVCELTNEDKAVQVRLTYDPSIPEYSISITSGQGWSPSPTFAIRFAGPRGLIISTERQVISDDRATVTVKDSGFGNVLDGLEFNNAATAILGNEAVTFRLENAGPAVRAFRACTAGTDA